MGIASFDVFDTVLARAVGAPAAVFLLLGRRLRDLSLLECTAEAFARAREAAELRAYRNVGVEHTTLEHIYAELGSSLWLEPAVCGHMMQLECELEAELLRPVPGTRQLIHEARAQGHRLVFVSDMYLPEEFIRTQLVRHELFEAGDGCYVSSAHKKMKGTGELFRQVLEDEQVGADRVVHHGNHPDFDVVAARRLGLQARAFDEGNLNRYEHVLEEHSSATEGLTSMMAGASRLARLSVPVSSERERALRDVAAGVAAPALVGFMLWVLHKAKQAGLARLYFVSRDGQILLEIARRLASKLSVNCELRYLYGSRQAWNLAGIKSHDDIDWSWIWDNTDVLSVESLLARVCIRPDEVKEDLAAHSFPEATWSRNLAPPERSALKELMERQAMTTLIVRRAEESREVFVKYLRQEGLLDPVDWALVDLGWGGSLQSALASTLSDLRDAPAAGLYFGLEDRPRGKQFGSGETYFYDVKHGSGFLQPARWQWVLSLEMFCTADHGTVLALVDESGSVGPRLKEERNATALEWGLEIVQRTVCSFAENLCLDSKLINPRADVRAAVERLLEAFWLSPTRSEALAWGEFPWEDGFGAHSYVRKLADSYDWRSIARAFYSGSPVGPRRPCWPAGSFASMPSRPQRALRAVLLLGGWRNLRVNATDTCWRWIRNLETRHAVLPASLLRALVFLMRPGVLRRVGRRIGYFR